MLTEESTSLFELSTVVFLHYTVSRTCATIKVLISILSASTENCFEAGIRLNENLYCKIISLVSRIIMATDVKLSFQ
jgi:hypothetical protein